MQQSDFVSFCLLLRSLSSLASDNLHSVVYTCSICFNGVLLKFVYALPSSFEGNCAIITWFFCRAGKNILRSDEANMNFATWTRMLMREMMSTTGTPSGNTTGMSLLVQENFIL